MLTEDLSVVVCERIVSEGRGELRDPSLLLGGRIVSGGRGELTRDMRACSYKRNNCQEGGIPEICLPVAVGGRIGQAGCGWLSDIVPGCRQKRKGTSEKCGERFCKKISGQRFVGLYSSPGKYVRETIPIYNIGHGFSSDFVRHLRSGRKNN